MTRDTIGIKRGSVDSFIQNLVDLQQRKNRRGATDFVKWLFLQQCPSMFNFTLFKIQRMALCLAQSKMQLKSQLGRAQDIPVRIGNRIPLFRMKYPNARLGYSCKDWKQICVNLSIVLALAQDIPVRIGNKTKLAESAFFGLAQDIPVRIGNCSCKFTSAPASMLRIFL